MRLYWLLMLIASVGCMPRAQPTPQPDPPKPVAPVAPDLQSSAEFYGALARRVDRGLIVDTDELLLIVAAAVEAGDLPDATAIDRALPDARKTNRKLDAANRTEVISALKSLK